jgi:hypothetical protein
LRNVLRSPKNHSSREWPKQGHKRRLDADLLVLLRSGESMFKDGHRRAHGLNAQSARDHHAGGQGQPVYTGGCPWPRPRQGSPTRRSPRRGVPGPRLVHMPSEPSGSQRSPAVHHSPRWQVRSCANRAAWRTLIRMKSEVQVLPGPPPATISPNTRGEPLWQVVYRKTPHNCITFVRCQG